MYFFNALIIKMMFNAFSDVNRAPWTFSSRTHMAALHAFVMDILRYVELLEATQLPRLQVFLKEVRITEIFS